jgi:hypothetical protein
MMDTPALRPSKGCPDGMLRRADRMLSQESRSTPVLRRAGRSVTACGSQRTGCDVSGTCVILVTLPPVRAFDRSCYDAPGILQQFDEIEQSLPCLANIGQAEENHTRRDGGECWPNFVTITSIAPPRTGESICCGLSRCRILQVANHILDRVRPCRVVVASEVVGFSAHDLTRGHVMEFISQ